MAKKLNLSQFHRAAPVTETKTFTDVLQPGVEIEVTIRAVPEHNTALKVQEISQKYLRQYVTAADGERIAPPHVDGKAVEITAALCITAAILMVMIVTPDGEDAYSFDDYLVMNVLFPNAYGDIVEFAEKTLKKASGGDRTEIPPGSAAR